MDQLELERNADEARARGDWQTAYGFYLVLAKASPLQEAYRLRLGECCENLGRKPDALRLYKHLAANLIRQGKAVQAMAVNQRILSLDPNDSEIQQQLMVLIGQNDEDSAALAQQRTQREVAAARVQQIAAAPFSMPSFAPPPIQSPNPTVDKPLPSLRNLRPALEPHAAPHAQGSEPAYDNIFDVSTDLGFAGANTNVDLSIGGHDGYMVIQGMEENAAHLTLMGAPPPTPKVETIPLFSELPPKALERIMVRVKRWSSAPDTVLIRQGDPGNSILILVHGSAKVVRKIDTQVSELSRLQAGDFFGEFAFFSRRPREASVVSTSPVEILELERTLMTEVMSEYPKVERAMQNLYRDRVLENLLRDAPLFAPLSHEHRKALAARFSHRQFTKGQTIIREGDFADVFYVIQCGKVAVMKSGISEPLAVLAGGEFFGETAMIMGSGRTASVIALETTDVVGMTKEVFIELMKSHPKVLEGVREIARQRAKALQAPRS